MLRKTGEQKKRSKSTLVFHNVHRYPDKNGFGKPVNHALSEDRFENRDTRLYTEFAYDAAYLVKPPLLDPQLNQIIVKRRYQKNMSSQKRKNLFKNPYGTSYALYSLFVK